jgi:hypothetical protein
VQAEQKGVVVCREQKWVLRVDFREVFVEVERTLLEQAERKGVVVCQEQKWVLQVGLIERSV